VLRMPGGGSCRRGGCAAGLRKSGGGSCRRGGGAVVLRLPGGGSCLVVDVQLCSGCLVVEAAVEVEVWLGSGA